MGRTSPKEDLAGATTCVGAATDWIQLYFDLNQQHGAETRGLHCVSPPWPAIVEVRHGRGVENDNAHVVQFAGAGSALGIVDNVVSVVDAGCVYMAALDSSSSLLALAEVFDPGRTAHVWATAWAAGEPVVIDDPRHLHEMLDLAQALVLERSAMALGFIDVSRARRGLARAWSSAGGRELLSAGPAMHVEADPANGLCVTSYGEPAVTFINVAEVTTVDDVAVVLGDDGTVSFRSDAADPLRGLVPGSTHWRVRRIPEVLVWAKTFHRLREACLCAVADDLTVRLHLASSSTVAADPG